MELVQELLFTISLSLIVSLLIAKFFSIASSGNSTVPIRVEELADCYYEKEGKSEYVEDPVKGSDEVEIGCFGGELGSGVVVENKETVGACYVFDESPERTEINDFDTCLGKSDEGNVVNSTGSLVEEDCVRFVEVERVLLSAIDDEDWQGVETSDLERRFGAAVAFMDAKVNNGIVSLIDNEVKIELYGLHRVVTEGSCFEPQPMALKVSARANWNSWKRLENIGREDAMEQYIALLSQHVPGWMGNHTSAVSHYWI